MSRPEGFGMHQAAKRAAPEALPDLESHLSKPKRKVVAVEKHDADWRDTSLNVDDRFLWIKARDVSIVFPMLDPLIAESARRSGNAMLISRPENHGAADPRLLPLDLRHA